MEVIRCEGLAKRYGRTVAVEGLDLVVQSGQVFGFLGPNGSGKTTTMRMLLGLVRPTAGRMWVNGRACPDPRGLTRVGAMIEEPAFYPWMTGRENLRVLALHGPPLPRTAVGAALERVGLTDVADRKVKTYSQGMRQRLGLAAALLRDPAVLLLDEPTNGMDPAGIRELRALLRTLADEGTTVFLSSHLLAEVEQVCDRVAVVNRGRLIEEGPVAGLAAARPVVRVLLEPGELDKALRLLSRWSVHTDGPETIVVDGTTGREVNEALGRGGVWAREVRTERSGLEETFLKLTVTEEDDRAPAARRTA